jgi:parallel beta-helix repeat protein
MVVVDCSICDNGFAGLVVHEDGTLLVKDSRLHNNGTIGLCIGPEASKCIAVNCDIHQSEHAGIGIANSKNVTLIRNNVFDNDMEGINIINSDVDIRDNNIFDNGSWGIWSQSNSWCNISMNRVCRNKAGGVRVGYRAAGKMFSQSVVHLN